MDINKSYTFRRPEYFDLNQIFDCGQCFRFDKSNINDNFFEGIAYGRHITLLQNEDSITIFGSDEKDFKTIWKNYFALDENYPEIRADILKKFKNDKTILSAMEKGKGIRILRQDAWETIISFIISQNNNIPRIKKIISSLSERFGEKIYVGNDVYYSFPTARSLYDAGIDEIFALKTGFRAAYIYDAAKKVVEGELDLISVSQYDTDKLIEALMKVKGIGPKVASCAALFGFGKKDSFPVDVWVKKVIEKYYPKGLDIKSLGAYSGIAQQYLFYYERYKS